MKSKEKTTEKNCTKKLEKYFEIIKKELNELKIKSKNIEKAIETRKLYDKDFQDSIYRIKKTFLNVNNTHVIVLVKDLFNVQKEYTEISSEKMKTKLKIYRSDLKDEQINKLVRNPEDVQRVIQKVMYGQEQAEMNNAIDDIKEQLSDIKKIENSVFTLLTMLETFHENLKEQATVIDSIYENVVSIKNHMERAETSIE